jgi:hypothetical protein
MSSVRIDPKARVVYIRDAKIFPNFEREIMELHVAMDTAIANHKAGEAPVIIGNNLRLIGIDAIRSARATNGQ